MFSVLIDTNVHIDSPAEAVWAALTDFGSYPKWNPYFREATGAVAVGETVRLQAELSPGRTASATARLSVVTAPTALEWRSRLLVPGLLDTTHRFSLTPLGDYRTRLQQTEHLRGALLPLARGTVTRIEVKLAEMNDGLKTWVETPGRSG